MFYWDKNLPNSANVLRLQLISVQNSCIILLRATTLLISGSRRDCYAKGEGIEVPIGISPEAQRGEPQQPEREQRTSNRTAHRQTTASQQLLKTGLFFQKLDRGRQGLWGRERRKCYVFVCIYSLGLQSLTKDNLPILLCVLMIKLWVLLPSVMWDIV